MSAAARYRLFPLVVLLGLFGAASAAALPDAVTWGSAIEVPGTAALNVGADATVNAVWCASAGNCAAGGEYSDGPGSGQAFVVSEKGGTWGDAIEVPGTGALNHGGTGQVSSVSCARAGECAAGGYYADGSMRLQAFVVSEHHGVWGMASRVSGTAVLNPSTSSVTAVSCAGVGACAAGGSYLNVHGRHAFVVTEKNGKWGKAIEAPGTAALNRGRNASVLSVSCASAGNCTAGGNYTDRSRKGQAFVVVERSGTWGKAIEVPGTAALNRRGEATVTSVSCASRGNCIAGGRYTDSSENTQAFLVSERKGKWRKAIAVPGLAALNRGGDAELSSVACPRPANCTAGGLYSNGGTSQQAFVVTEKSGKWSQAIKVPRIATLNHGYAAVTSVSCASAANCAAGGYYRDSSKRVQAFIVAETSGQWGKGTEVPGTASLNVGGLAQVYSISCVALGKCAVGGRYNDQAGQPSSQAFVTTP